MCVATSERWLAVRTEISEEPPHKGKSTVLEDIARLLFNKPRQDHSRVFSSSENVLAAACLGQQVAVGLYIWA